MAELPTGTVTFLFTDVEGSTRLWEDDREGMRLGLARHDEILRATIESHGGYVFTTAGDSFAVAFGGASDGARAALEAQLALGAERWGTAEPLRVRMAVHSGTAELRDGDYFGPALNRAARLLAAAHGLQILISGAAAELVQDHLPEETRLVDLGEHQLRDLTRPERVFQLAHRDLRLEFPPLRTLKAVHRNVPDQLTSFVGRAEELRVVEKMLAESRLVSLVGPGGSGKTRLAIQTAAEVLDRHPDGAFFVDLAPLADPEAVALAAAQALGLGDRSGLLPADAVVEYLRDREALLILDNAEHLLPAAADLSEKLLKECLKVRLLVTSREPLGVSGEAVWPVPPMTLHETDDLSQLAGSDAVRLFVERAEKVSPEFEFTEENAAPVGAICRRLDGMPLAIELAAARARLLSPAEIAERLDDRFRLLVSKSRTTVARHQTLRAAIDWSYRLLTDEEQALFARLSVFTGGLTMEAADEVCPNGEVEADQILDLLASLVDKSLLLPGEGTGGSTRYRLLETLREYAQERLEESEDAKEFRRRHVAYFLELARQAGHELHGSAQAVWLNLLDDEHDNFRSAVAWALKSGKPEIVLQMAVSVWWFWMLRSHMTEGRRWVERGLDATSQPTENRAGALHAAGNLAFWQGDHGAATTMLQASLDLHRQLENRAGEGFAHLGLGIVAWGDGDLDRSADLLWVASDVLDQEEEAWGAVRARTYMAWVGMMRDDPDSKKRAEASLAEAQALGDRYHINVNTLTLGVLAHKQGDLEQAQALYQKGLASCREIGDQMGEAYLHGWLGVLARHRGNLPQAREHLRRAEDLFRRDSYAIVGSIKIDQSITARQQTDISDAVEALQEAWVIASRTGSPPPIGALRETASLMAEVGLPERSAVLYGAAAALGGPPPLPGSPWRTEYDQDMEILRAQLHTDSLDQAWAKGGALNPAEAFDEAATALEELQTSSDRFERKATSADRE